MTESRMTFARCMVLGGAWTVVGFLVLPMLIIFPVSLTDQYYLSMPKEEISFRHYENFFSDDRWLAAFGQSVFIGLSATVCAVILGTLCAVGCWRIASNRSELVRTLISRRSSCRRSSRRWPSTRCGSPSMRSTPISALSWRTR